MLRTFLLFLILAPLLLIQVAHARDFDPNWDGNIVYYISGGPFDVQPESINQSAAELRKQVEARLPHAYFDYPHNSSNVEICETIKTGRMAPLSRSGKTVIVGHSYGASATSIISRCLEKEGIQVDLAVFMDMVQRPIDSQPDVISDNIIAAKSFYQTRDIILHGLKNVRRKDGTHGGISNTEVTAHIGFTPHFDLVSEIMLNTSEVEDAVVEALITH